MASKPGHARISQGNPTSGRLSPRKDYIRPKYACGPLDNIHPFLTNGKCIEGRYASVVRRRTKSGNLRESKSRNVRDLHLEAIQREKSSRKLSVMPALQLRVSSVDSSVQKIKKKNRSSVLFFGRADQAVDSPTSASPSDQLPALFKLDNSSFLDLFQRETRHTPSSAVPKCQRASTMPRLSTRPAESLFSIDHSSYFSPVSPATPNNHPWSPNGAYANVNQLCTEAMTHAPAAARSPSASSRSSDPHNSARYFSSVASQSSQSSFGEGNAPPSPRATRSPKPKYLLTSKEQICDLEVVQTSDLEVVQTSAKLTNVGKRTFSEPLSRNKPLPSEPLVDIASPFFEIACPAVRAVPPQRFSTSNTNQAGNFRSRRSSSSSSRRGRPKSPNLSRLSRGERLGLALTLHAQGVKIPNIVRHELPTQLHKNEEISPESGDSSPISKLISELQDFPTRDPVSSHNAGSPASQYTVQTPHHRTKGLADTALQSTEHTESDSAEKIILNILSALDIHDLLTAARINKGFYSVFKRHQLSLIKSAIFNTCPAAWEYFEEACKGSIVPTKLLESYRNGLETIASLRTTLLLRCDGLLRQETISGLVRADKQKSRNIDQAFWRIWTFCDIFGHKSTGRNNSQLQADWLRGGRANQDQISNLPGTQKFRPFSLTELLDINEIWSCLATLLQGFHDQPSHAQDAGLFERCQIDNNYTEEFYIKRWTGHVMTFGLNAVLELSCCSFEDARTSGWTRWSPAPAKEKETTFLTDAVAVVYQSILIEEAEIEASKVTLPRKASGRARSAKKRHIAHGDVLRIQTQNLPRKAVGSPARKPSVALSSQFSSAHPSYHDPCSPIPEASHSADINPTLQKAVRRRSVASPAITASMFQALSLQPGASTQIGPTLFPHSPSSSRSSSHPTQPRPITPLSSIQSTPIALTPPERVPHREPDSAGSLEQFVRPPPAPPAQSDYGVVSPVVDPVEMPMDLLVKEMGFPPAAVKDALASCKIGSQFDLDTVIAMIVSASDKPATIPAAATAMAATVRTVQPTELESSRLQVGPYPQLQTRSPSQEARQSTRKRQEKSAYSAQTKLADFIGGGRSRNKEQKRQSKMKAFQVLGVAQDRRMSTMVGGG